MVLAGMWLVSRERRLARARALSSFPMQVCRLVVYYF